MTGSSQTPGWQRRLDVPVPGSLNAEQRDKDLTALAGDEVVDVLVIGGGITGVGVALDAASRGLTVALIEKGDLAAGTSSKSSKLVHGGLRYLFKMQVGIAADSARERHLLSSVIAPHLLSPIPFLLPIGANVPGCVGRRDAGAARAGLTAADALRVWARTPSQLLPATRRVSSERALELVPGLRRDGLLGGLVTWDLQLTDDARLVIAVARTAAALGARIVTRATALQIGNGGAVAVDEVTGSRFEIRARHVINATGVWADQLDPAVRLRPSRGTHVVVPAAALGNPTAQLTVNAGLGRAVFAPPRPDGTVLLGLTDDPHNGSPDEVIPSEREIDSLLEIISGPLERPLQRDDVIGAFTGLRPLLDIDSGPTHELSRDHAVLSHDGVTSVVGGKLTTYRRMAADAVDRVTDRPCVTESIALVGATQQAPHPGLPDRLARRFGAEAPRVAALAEGRPHLLEPIAPGVPALGVEVLWAVRHEGALDVDDVLDARLRLDLVPQWRARAAEAAAALMDDSGVATAARPPRG